MKRNFIFKFSLVALILTLITMPLVSGTYAKYVTQADGNAKARVAKWGVGIDLDASRMFGVEYYGKDGTLPNQVRISGTQFEQSDSKVTVKSQTDKFVVAPGTKGQIEFTLSGEPEVATKLEIRPAFKFEDDGTNDNWKVLGKDYYPLNFAFGIEVNKIVSDESGSGDKIKRYLKVNKETSGAITTEFQDKPFYFTHEEIMSVIVFLNEETAEIKPNQEISQVLYDVFEKNSGSTGNGDPTESFGKATGKYIFEWIWPYERSEKNPYAKWEAMETAIKDPSVLGPSATTKDIYDYADTVLGDKPEADLPTIKIDYSISITQID